MYLIEFVFVIFLVGIVALLFCKYKAGFLAWMKDPVKGHDYIIPREVRLQRHIEDAQAELEWMKEKQRKKEEVISS